jgi:plastocyanin
MHTNYKKGIAPIVIALIVAALLGGGYAITKKNSKQRPVEEKSELKETGANKSTSFPLMTQNNSGQSGTATISKADEKTKVVIDITTPAGATGTTTQPAHIHESLCATIGAVKYPLANVVNGKSETMLDVSYDALMNAGPLSLNIHKSATDVKIYVACGDLPTKEKKDKDGMGTTTPNQVNTGKSNAAEANTTNVVEVNYTAAGFVPKTIEIKAGQTVKFINKTSGALSVASDPHPTHTNYPEFDQWKSSAKGQKEYSFTFTKIGTWGYHNHADESKTGTVIVK